MSTTGGVPASNETNDDLPLTATSPRGNKEDPESPTTSGSDESVAKQLRDKLTESGRREKEALELARSVREQNEQLQTLIAEQRQSLQPKPNGDTGYERFADAVFDENATPEQARAALTDYVAAVAEDTANKVRAEFTQQMEAVGNRGRADRAINYGVSFFAEKGVPELADRDSDFYSFVLGKMKDGDAFTRGLWSSVDDAPQEVYPLMWEKYLAHKGIKPSSTTPEQRREMEEAALADHPSNTLSVNKDALQAVEAAADKAGRDLSMLEMSQIMAKEGHFKE